MDKNVTLTTSTGVKIVGPVEEVKKLVGAVAFDGTVNHDEWYFSSSKGFIRIKSMASQHIKNAILKMCDGWMTSMRMAKTPGEFVKLLESGPKDMDTITGLAKELGLRNLYGYTWTYSGDK
jgi:hypothetical protein